MEDVARRAGVSLITVSRAYRYPDKVAEETRKSIDEAATELGYVPNLVAGDLASNRSRVIGLIVPSLTNSTLAKTINGLVDGVAARNYELLFAISGLLGRQGGTGGRDVSRPPSRWRGADRQRSQRAHPRAAQGRRRAGGRGLDA